MASTSFAVIHSLIYTQSRLTVIVITLLMILSFFVLCQPPRVLTLTTNVCITDFG